jgi:hypothetical protein
MRVDWRKEFMKNKLMLMEAFLMLGIFKVLLRTMKLRQIAGFLGKSNRVTDFSDTGINTDIRRRVSGAVRRMSRHTPWESNCLVQACAAKLMLNLRKQPGTVYFGVRKNKKGKMIAHAWVRCGTYYVCGGNGDGIYQITGTLS